MKEMDDHATPFYERAGQWILMSLVILVGVWLWVSWRNAWPPFESMPMTSSGADASAEHIQENLFQSLTATATPQTGPGPILKDLTPTKSSKPSTVDTNAVLDSLTPKK